MDVSKTDERESLEFEVITTPEGGFLAACKQKKIFIEANDLQELHDGIQQSVDKAYLKYPARKPTSRNIRLIVHQFN